MEINICKEFTDTPNGRYKSEGHFSGEEFRENLLEPRYLEAKEKREKLTINMDGGYGYPTSFLEEAFGGLARKYDLNEVLQMLIFISDDEPSLIEEIESYIKNANRRGAKRKK